jgi:hypothetical protein
MPLANRRFVVAPLPVVSTDSVQRLGDRIRERRRKLYTLGSLRWRIASMQKRDVATTNGCYERGAWRPSTNMQANAKAIPAGSAHPPMR